MDCGPLLKKKTESCVATTLSGVKEKPLIILVVLLMDKTKIKT